MLLAHQVPLPQGSPTEIGRLDQEHCRLRSSIPTRIGSSCLSQPHVGFGVPVPLSHWSGHTVLRPVGPRPKVFLVKEKQTHVTPWGRGAGPANAPVISAALLVWASLL